MNQEKRFSVSRFWIGTCLGLVLVIVFGCVASNMALGLLLSVGTKLGLLRSAGSEEIIYLESPSTGTYFFEYDGPYDLIQDIDSGIGLKIVSDDSGRAVSYKRLSEKLYYEDGTVFPGVRTITFVIDEPGNYKIETEPLHQGREIQIAIRPNLSEYYFRIIRGIGIFFAILFSLLCAYFYYKGRSPIDVEVANKKASRMDDFLRDKK